MVPGGPMSISAGSHGPGGGTLPVGEGEEMVGVMLGKMGAVGLDQSERSQGGSHWQEGKTANRSRGRIKINLRTGPSYQ
jgi:hypothetical protein